MVQAVLGKNGLGLPSLAYAPRALSSIQAGWDGGGAWMGSGWPMTCRCTRLNDSRGQCHTAAHARTEHNSSKEVLGEWRFTGRCRCPRAGWRGRQVGVAYIDSCGHAARRMGGGYSASDDGFVSCGRVEIPISPRARQCHPCPGALGRLLTYLLT